MASFFKKNGTKVKKEEESNISEPQQIFVGEDIADGSSMPLLDFIYMNEYLDDAYDAIMKNNYDSKALISLCDDVNNALKQNKISDKDVRQQTPKTVALEIVKAYSVAITDDYKGESDKLQKTIATGKAKIIELEGELEQTKQSYDDIVAEYNATLAKQSSGEMIPSSVKEELEAEIADLRTEIESKQEYISNLEDKCKNLEEALAKTKTEMQQLNSNLDALANTNTGDDKIEELIQEINERDIENAKLNSEIVTLKNDLTQARRDAKMRVSNKDAINGLKSTIALLSDNLSEATKECLELLEELGETKQTLEIKEQELIAEKSLCASYKSKAEAKIKSITDGSILKMTKDTETSETSAITREEVASTEIEQVSAEPEILEGSTTVEEDGEDIIKISRDDLKLLMVASIETRSMATKFVPEYRNSIQDQFDELIDHRSEFRLPLPNLKESLNEIFADKIME